MAGRRSFLNNWAGVLDGGIDDTTNTIVFDSPHGLNDLPIGTSAAATNYQAYYYILTISNDAGDVECVQAVRQNIDGVTIYVNRGVEETTPQAWADGDSVEIRATAYSQLGRDNLLIHLLNLDPPSISSPNTNDRLLGISYGDSGEGPTAFGGITLESVGDYYNTLTDNSTAAWVEDTDTTLATDYLIPTNEMVKSYVAANGGGGSSDSFKTIVVSGQSDVVADSSTDTLTLVAGSNITLTTNTSTDTITIAASGGGGGSQTPWTSDIDTAGYKLTNATTSGGVNVETNNTLTLTANAIDIIDYNTAQGGSIKLFEASANGASYISLSAPADVTTTYTFTFPPAAGSSGQYLKYDGTWDTPGITDGDKGDITVSSSGSVWAIDTPASATVATDDKVLIKDTSASDVMKYVTAQSIRDLVPGSGTITSAQLATALTDETGSGALVFANSPTLVTPTLGVAAATSISFGQDPLNYYDEGLFTPIFYGSTTAGSPTGVFSGRYIRIGKLCNASVQCVFTGLDTMAGNLLMTGAPFNAVNSSAARSGICVGFRGNFTNKFDIIAYFTNNSTILNFWRADQDATRLVIGDLTATTNLYFSITYEVA